MVDTIIRLFPSTEQDFSSNGLGILSDATSCIVVEERNGAFELEMKYPISGRLYKEISLRKIICTKPNPYDQPQPFRIYEISRPMKNLVTVKAAHISYDMNGIPVEKELNTAYVNVTSAFDIIERNVFPSMYPFTLWTDKSATGKFQIDKYKSLKACLGGTEGSILDVYGGEYEFDRFLVKLHNKRGRNRGVSIRYGKNLTDLKQDETSDNLYTGVYGYWDGTVEEKPVHVETSPRIIAVPGSWTFTNVLILDLSSKWQDPPTPSNLKAAVNSYISKNKIGEPNVNLDISFVNLMDAEEYETLGLLETVHLCDEVTVVYEELGVNARSECIKTTYNCITGKYEGMELGNAKSLLSNTLADKVLPGFGKLELDMEKALNEQYTLQKQVVDHATKLITGNLGGHVILHSSTGGSKPDEILIMDTENINTAKRIWRWNLSGWGYSKRGYNGPYTTAATMDGVIVADFIQAGTMSANRIKGGVLFLGGRAGGSYGNGEIKIYNSRDVLTLQLRDGLLISYSDPYNTNDGDYKLVLDHGKMDFYWNNNLLGGIGTNYFKNYKHIKGLVFDLDDFGEYMSWGCMNDNNVYVTKIMYNRDELIMNNILYEEDTFHHHTDVDFHYNKLKKVRWNFGSGVSGTLEFVQPLAVRVSDGTLKTWNKASLTFENGILKQASWGTGYVGNVYSTRESDSDEEVDVDIDIDTYEPGDLVIPPDGDSSIKHPTITENYTKNGGDDDGDTDIYSVLV